LIVTSVTPGSAAVRAGMQAGDIITRFAGSIVRSTSEFNTIRAQFRVGDTTTITAYRAGREIQFEINFTG